MIEIKQHLRSFSSLKFSFAFYHSVYLPAAAKKCLQFWNEGAKVINVCRKDERHQIRGLILAFPHFFHSFGPIFIHLSQRICIANILKDYDISIDRILVNLLLGANLDIVKKYIVKFCVPAWKLNLKEDKLLEF